MTKTIKAEKPAKASKKKAEKPAIALATHKAVAGHNSGKINQPLVELFAKYHEAEENKKQISKYQRDLRAKAKEEHGIPAKNFTHEINMQKLDKDVRVQFEQTSHDLKTMLGYQFALNLASTEQDGGAKLEKESVNIEENKEIMGSGPEEPEDNEDEHEEVEAKVPSFLRRVIASDTAH